MGGRFRGGATKVVEIGLTRRRIFLLEALLVGDGLLLDILDVHRAPYRIISLKAALGTFTAQN